MKKSDIKHTCTYIEYSDLVGVAFSEDQSEMIAETLMNSEISYGNNNRTMVSLGRMCELVRQTNDIDPDDADTVCDKLCKLLKPNEYIDVEN
jgi:hypothetical protein